MADSPQGEDQLRYRTTSLVHRALAVLTLVVYLATAVAALGALSTIGRAALGQVAWGTAATWAAALAVSVVAAALLDRLFYRDFLRQRRIGAAVAAVASERGWTLLERDVALERGWVRAPFSDVRRLGAIPATRGGDAGSEAGVACLVGDLPVAGASARAFLSRVAWVELPPGVPSMSIVPQGFADHLVVAIGGRDVDVESHEFNRRWRVLTEDDRGAHAVLQPVMIELMNSVGQERIALSINGTRAIAWDDGADATVDLARRLALVESFVAAIPAYLRAGEPAPGDVD